MNGPATAVTAPSASRAISSSPNVETVELQIMAAPQRTIATPSVHVRRTRSARTPNGRLASAATTDETATSRPMSVLLMSSARRSSVADAPTVDASALPSARTDARRTTTRVRCAPPSVCSRRRAPAAAVRRTTATTGFGLRLPPASAATDVSSLGRLDSSAERDRASLEDVRAQAGAVDERTQQPRTGQRLQVCARLREPAADAHHVADREAAADEAVQCDASRDDVPARVLPAELERVEDVRVDERQLVAETRRAERPAPLAVAVSGEASPRDGLDRSAAVERLLGTGRREDRLDDPGRRPSAVGLLDRQMHVESREQPAFLDRPAAPDRSRRVVQRPRRRAEHDHGVVAVRRSHAGDPVPRPVELGGVRDRHEAEVPAGQPVPQEADSVRTARRRAMSENGLDALPELLVELRHARLA